MKKQTEEKFIMKPKVDFCFKELMEEADVRRGFISAMLGISPEEVLETRLLPTLLRKKYEEDKLGILDVRVLLNEGTQIDIEIQVSTFAFWQERSLFYLGKMYSSQLEKGEAYGEMEKCIHMGILDFILFPDEAEFHFSFHMWEDRKKFLYTDKLEVHILELPKLEKQTYPETELLNWARFMNAKRQEEFEEVAEKNEYIQKAYEHLKDISGDELKRLEYEAREKAIRDHNHLIKYNREEGREEGRNMMLQEQIQKKLAKGKNIPTISKELEVDISLIEKLIAQMEHES